LAAGLDWILKSGRIKSVEENIVQDHLAEIQSQPEKPWLKIALFSVLSLFLAGGLVWEGYKLGQRQTPLTFTPLFAPTPTRTLQREIYSPLNETVNWVAYMDPKYNYEIRYPKDWNVETNWDLRVEDEGIFFRDPNGIIKVIIQVINNPESLDLISYLTRYPLGETAIIGNPGEELEREQRKIAEKMVRASTEIIIDGKPAFKFNNIPAFLPLTEVILFKKELVFHFVLAPRKTPFPDVYQTIFDLMLSTFKFLD
jgi:hypothetical protein